MGAAAQAATPSGGSSPRHPHRPARGTALPAPAVPGRAARCSSRHQHGRNVRPPDARLQAHLRQPRRQYVNSEQSPQDRRAQILQRT